MWKILDSNNNNITKTFIDAATKEHQQAVRITFLNLNFVQVSNNATLDSCFCLDANRNVTNFVSDGNVDVDVDRLIRRTAELTILNPTNQFTPRRSIDVDTDEDKPGEPALVGYVYLNRYVRIERGIHLGNGQHIYAPVGTFMIDVAEIIAERNMTVVNLTLSDLAKRLTKSYFIRPKKYDANTHYNTIIKDLLDQAGITNAMIGSIDNLSIRQSEDEKKINKILKFERGESRGEKLKELCDKWDIDIYFDPMGKLRTEDRRRDKGDKGSGLVAPVFTFAASDRQPGEGAIVSIKRSLSDDNLFNHLVVVGTGNEKNPVIVSRKNTNPKSKTNVERIGFRTYLIETERANTEAEANKILDRQWKRRLHLEESVTIDAICMPLLEGNDVIGVRDDEYTRVYKEKKGTNIAKRYRLKRFNIPLVTSRQSLEVTDTVTMDEL